VCDRRRVRVDPWGCEPGAVGHHRRAGRPDWVAHRCDRLLQLARFVRHPGADSANAADSTDAPDSPDAGFVSGWVNGEHGRRPGQPRRRSRGRPAVAACGSCRRTPSVPGRAPSFASRSPRVTPCESLGRGGSSVHAVMNVGRPALGRHSSSVRGLRRAGGQGDRRRDGRRLCRGLVSVAMRPATAWLRRRGRRSGSRRRRRRPSSRPA
jgi:hypothetical protein